MRKYVGPTLVFGVSLVVALVGYIYGKFDDLWVSLGVPVESHAVLTVGFSIFLLLIGHFLSTLMLTVGQVSDLDRKIESFERSLNSSLGGVSGLRVCQTSDAALTYIAARLPHAKKVWNTRVPAPGVGDYGSPEALAYSRAMKKAINAGVHFRDVVGRVFEERAKEISNARAVKGADNYCYVLLPEPNVPFFNFIVIEDVSGFREVIFGWVITPVRGFEQECFVSNNARLIDTFIALHEYMITSYRKK